MDDLNLFIEENRDKLIYDKPYVGHRTRFALRLKKTYSFDKVRCDVSNIAKSAAAAVFFYIIIVPSSIQPLTDPGSQVETANVTADIWTSNPVKKRKVITTPSQLQQASFNLKQLGYDEVEQRSSSYFLM